MRKNTNQRRDGPACIDRNEDNGIMPCLFTLIASSDAICDHPMSPIIGMKCV